MLNIGPIYRVAGCPLCQSRVQYAEHI